MFGQIVTLTHSFTSSDDVARRSAALRTLTQAFTKSESLIGKKISFRTLTDTLTLIESLSILSGRARQAIAYLLKRVGDIDYTIRANNSSITKRTANARTDEY